MSFTGVGTNAAAAPISSNLPQGPFATRSGTSSPTPGRDERLRPGDRQGAGRGPADRQDDRQEAQEAEPEGKVAVSLTATFTPNGGTAGTSNDSPSLRKKL